jgi:V8-like Glu-specific endopeptidase
MIYHYPKNLDTQRINEGLFYDNGTHHITTLDGSSGAPIFCDGTIVAIHTGGAKERNAPMVKYKSFFIGPVVKFNRYIPVAGSFCQMLCMGD